MVKKMKKIMFGILVLLMFAVLTVPAVAGNPTLNYLPNTV